MILLAKINLVMIGTLWSLFDYIIHFQEDNS